MRVLVLGGTGFVGSHLLSALKLAGHDASTVSLRDPVAAAAQAAPCDAVINVAGETVAQRWSKKVKERIESSRIELPRRFLEALSRHERRTRVYISASAIGYYPTDPERAFDETSAPGDDFLARVCAGWESAALGARDLGMRVALVRTGVALGTGGGALAEILPIFRFGLGGRLGSGKQWFSWIHVGDLCGIYLAALERGEGAYDATAPNPVTNAEFTRELGAALRKPAVVPVPPIALRLRFGEAAHALLASQRVLPKRTMEELNYAFAFPQLAPALQNLVGR